MHVVPYLIIFGIACLLTVVFAIFAWHHRQMASARALEWLAWSVAIWALFYIVEFIVPAFAAKLLAARLQYLGIVCVPVAWLVFTRQYAGDYRWPSRRQLALLSIIPSITLALVWTNDLHGLIWSSVRLEPETALPTLEVDHGPWFWVHTLYFYLLMIRGSISLLRVIRRTPKLKRWGIGVLLICTLAPWLGNVLYLLEIRPIYPVSLTPLGFMISTLTLGWLLFHFGLPSIGTAQNGLSPNMRDDISKLGLDDRRTILTLLALGLLASLPISMRGGIDWADAHLPPWLVDDLEIAVSAAALLFGLLLIWLVSKRLTAALAEARAANAALRESVARYHAISDLTTDTIYSLRVADNAQIQLEWISDSFVSVTGYTLDDLRDQEGWLKVLHPDDRAIDQQHEAALLAGKSDVCEYRILTKQGQVRWFRDYARPIWDAELGRIVQILGAAQDITKQKQAQATQQLLAEASKLLASSLDYEATLVHVTELVIPQLADWCMIHLVDDDYSLRRVALIFADPAKQPLAEEVQREYPLGIDAPYSYPRVIRTGQPELVRQVSDAGLRAIAHDERHLELLRALGFCSTICVPLIARDRTIGSIGIGSAESRRRYDKADLQVLEELATCIAFAVDNARLFAERTAAAQRLRRQNEELTALHEMTLGLIDRLDVDSLLGTLVLRAGGLVGTAHGYLYVVDQAANELVVRAGSGIFATQIGYRLRRGQGLAGRVWETGQPISIENYQAWSGRQVDLDRLKLQAIASVPIRAGADFAGVLGLAYLEQGRVFGDTEIELLGRFADLASLALENARLYSAAQQEIAERRHTEAALLATEAELRAAKEQAEAATRAKSDMLSQMSHDMRTPISSVIGITALLEDTELDAEQRELVGIIRTSGDVLLTLVNNLLDLSKIESGKLTLEHHPFILQQCIEEAIDLVATDVISKGIDLAYTLDPQLPAILVSDQPRLSQILVNMLSNAVKFTPVGGILLSADGRPTAADQYEIHVRVADTGIGIPPDRLEHVFEPFEQVDRVAARPIPGTGLGLTIAKQLSELMGGHMWVESTYGQGSTFHFTIRVAAASSASIADAPAPRFDAALLRGRRVLIVDQHAQSRHALSEYAQTFGMHVSVASTTSQALALAGGGTGFDVAIVDRSEANVNGQWLGTILRQQYNMPNLRVILLTPLGVYGEEVQSESFDLIVHKPLKLTQLRDVLLRSVVGVDTLEVGRETPPARQAQFWQHIATAPRVLLVEDDHANQQLGVRVLQQLGCPHAAVSTGTAALEALERDPYDLVLLDVQLPDIDGLEVARRIRARGDQIRQPHLIALTADTQASVRAACIDAGMDTYLVKPLRTHELHALLAQYHQSVAASADLGAPPAATETAALATPGVSSAYPLDPSALERLRTLFGPDRTRLSMLIEHYCTDTAALLLQMSQAAADNDIEILRESAHQLKSSSRIVAALRLGALAERLEQALSDLASEQWRVIMAELEEEFLRVRTALAAE